MKKLIALLLILIMLLPVITLADDPDPIIGRWCIYWDTRPMNEQYNHGKPMMSFLILDYNLYLYENNVLYFTSSFMNTDGSFKEEWPAYEGFWLNKGDGKYSVKLLSGTYDAEFDDAGRLLVYITKDVPYPFIRIPSYDFIKENP